MVKGSHEPDPDVQWGSLSSLSREILSENKRKMFWILWKYFRKKTLKMELEKNRKGKRRSWNFKTQLFKEILSKASFSKPEQLELNQQTKQIALLEEIQRMK
jgi:hypothetical protein